MEWKDLLSYIFPGLLAYVVALRTSANNRKEEIISLRKALRTELLTLQSIYYVRKIPSTPPNDGNEIKTACIQSNYTTVYSKNADKIGLLSPDTAESVVIAYTHIATLIDTLRVYSQRWEDMIRNERYGDEKWQWIFQKDVIEAHKVAYETQEITLKAVDDAIKKLS